MYYDICQKSYSVDFDLLNMIIDNLAIMIITLKLKLV